VPHGTPASDGAQTSVTDTVRWPTHAVPSATRSRPCGTIEGISMPAGKSAASPGVDTSLHQAAHVMDATIRALCAAILATDARIGEAIKWNAPSFHVEGKHLATMQPRRADRVLRVMRPGAGKRTLLAALPCARWNPSRGIPVTSPSPASASSLRAACSRSAGCWTIPAGRFQRRRAVPDPGGDVHGRHDYTTPSEPTAAWRARVQAPYRQGVWFEHSAHMMPWEEPGKTLVSLLEYIRPRAVDATAE